MKPHSVDAAKLADDKEEWAYELRVILPTARTMAEAFDQSELIDDALRHTLRELEAETVSCEVYAY